MAEVWVSKLNGELALVFARKENGYLKIQTKNGIINVKNSELFYAYEMLSTLH